MYYDVPVDDLTVEGVDIIHGCLCLSCGGGNGVTRMLVSATYRITSVKHHTSQ